MNIICLWSGRHFTHKKRLVHSFSFLVGDSNMEQKGSQSMVCGMVLRSHLPSDAPLHGCWVSLFLHNENCKSGGSDSHQSIFPTWVIWWHHSFLHLGHGGLIPSPTRRGYEGWYTSWENINALVKALNLGLVFGQLFIPKFCLRSLKVSPVILLNWQRWFSCFSQFIWTKIFVLRISTEYLQNFYFKSVGQ